ncbi:TetR/AcrR family transcriptional regulator [Novosphingobium terrae]|jgi:TetR/AcrR family transcriptional regulator, mexJK operon transcriptional repressor|uniref:TetR/AcrR family transcriptional regulator n=1 Tax=Novosphingobium terrae TaxID=2726189 RepID=UPI00197DB9C9|nr:TetR/AcrR family transcriptional regulator [Novosphingobium terrae]
MSKREERRGERRATILETAGACFLEHGYAGTTMSAVAARLGGSKGTLWSYFSSKEELFAACIEEKTEIFRAELVQVLNPGAPLRPAIEGFCRRFMAKIREPQSVALYQLLCGEGTRAGEASRIFYERGPGVVQALLVAFLSGHEAGGRLSGGTPLEMAQVLISLCTGISHQRALLGLTCPQGATQPPPPEKIADLFFRLYAVNEAEVKRVA